MNGVWLARIRWRRRGAWMWPSFLALSLLDGMIGSLLPPQGASWVWMGAVLFGAFANLFAIVALSVPLRLGLRRWRPDLPKVVAQDYAGTTTMSAITVVLLIAGIVHHGRIQGDQRRVRDAIVRAQAYIGTHAPARFRSNVARVDTLPIQPGRIYRICVPSVFGAQEYCVAVDERRPLIDSVRPDGSESNATLDQGAQ